MSDYPTNLLHNICLKELNTFKLNVHTKDFFVINKKEDFILLYKNLNQLSRPFFILGDGSNVLFKGDFEGTILKIKCKGISLIKEYNDSVIVEANAGENWDNFVKYTLKNNWFGLENLSSIPGTVGASVVQNIGAFGKEVKEFIESITVFDINNGIFLEISPSEAELGYRTSKFKTCWNGKFIIYSLKFKLSKIPKIDIRYASLQKEIEKENIKYLTPLKIREIVIKLRKSNLPNLNKLGCAGSFFKNPVVSLSFFEKLKKEQPDIIFFPDQTNSVRLAAAWLIEKAGWKGVRIGNVGVFEKHALVIINYGDASPNEIIELSEKIKNSVKEKFDILLEPEVVIV